VAEIPSQRDTQGFAFAKSCSGLCLQSLALLQNDKKGAILDFFVILNVFLRRISETVNCDDYCFKLFQYLGCSSIGKKHRLRGIISSDEHW